MISLEGAYVKRRLLMLGLPLAVAVVAITILGARAPEERDGETGAERTGAEANRVRTEEIQPVTGPLVKRFPGALTGEDRGPVSFTVGGRVEELDVAVGNRVEQGQPLGRLDRRPFEHGVEQARAGLRRVETSLEQARRDLARVEALGEAATEEELEARRTAVEELEARRQGARSAFDEAERQLEESELTAPYAGEVTRQLVERGEVVSPGNPVYFISGEGDRLEVELSVPEETVGALAPEAPVTLSFPLSPELPPIEAEISSLSEHATMPGGLFRLTVRLPQLDGAERQFRPGLRVSAALPLYAGEELFSVKTGAVLSRPDGTPIVFAVRDGAAREVPLSMARVREGRILVRGPLEPGDRVVVSGHRTLVDGDPVEEVRL